MARAAAASKATLPRGVTGVLAVGALATLLIALPYPTFDLERYTVPKELALVLAGGIALRLLLREARAVSFGRAEIALFGYACWSVVSLVMAERWWPGIRATGVVLGGIAIFAAAGAVARAGRGRLLLMILAGASALGVATALAQAYGTESVLFSSRRAPGGVFGNRNFMAHAGVAGLALLVPVVLRARNAGAALAIALATVLAAGVVMSRSRAAWLALAAGAVATVAAAFLAGELARKGAGRRRLLLLGLAIVVGGAVAVLTPNDLAWRSDTPYLESLRGVADYRSGSGRGRIVQYRNTLEMARENPLLGTGPGNWPVTYPRYSSAGDPAFAATLPVPTNPWPSSDWMAILAERGLPALLLLVGAGLLLMARAVRRLDGNPDHRAASVGALGLLAVTLVIGCFDAHLLLPGPSLVILGGLGALLPADSTVLRRELTERSRRTLGILLLGVTCILAARLTLEITAMRMYERGGELRTLAAKVDPGNYRIRALLAQDAAKRGRCGEARRWATAALRRMPDAPFPRDVTRRC